MALAILTERDFVGDGGGQSCGCATAQGDQQWDYNLLMWRRVVRQTVTGRGQGRGMWQFVLNRGVRSASCSVIRNRSVVALTVSRLLFLVYLPWKYKIYFRWCRLPCTWYIPSIFSSNLSTTSHAEMSPSLTCITMEFHCIPQWYVLSFTCIFSRCCLSTSSRKYFSHNSLSFIFLCPGTKGSSLGSVIKHTFITPKIRNFCTFYACQLLNASCGIIARHCTIYVLLC